MEIRRTEIVPLYRVLREEHEYLPSSLCALLDRIEKELFERLSIEEIEAIPELGRDGVEELSKKL